jgi:hypothetical protein
MLIERICHLEQQLIGQVCQGTAANRVSQLEAQAGM